MQQLLASVHASDGGSRTSLQMARLTGCSVIDLSLFIVVRLIEMQAFVAELLENFQFDLPVERMEIRRAVAGFVMFPMVKGKESLGAAMPIRISLAQ